MQRCGSTGNMSRHSVLCVVLLLLSVASAQDSAPQNFSLLLTGTVLTASWDPPTGQTVTSYILSCSVNGNVELCVNISTTEVTIGVYLAETTYSCNVYASNSEMNGPPTADIAVTTGASSETAYLPFVPRNGEEEYLPTGDDIETSVNTVDFPFGTSVFTSLSVGSNGIISFGSVYNPFSNSAFPGPSGHYLLAPFWDDINIEEGGTISYEVFESGYFLHQVNSFIQRERHTYFNGTWMMNVYYKDVQPYIGSGENTFQAIMITDGTYSYAAFTYKCGLMGWDSGATIGFSASGNPYANNNPSSSAVACVNSPTSDWSNVIYLLSDASQEDPPPQDVTTSDITNSSATITWTVASLSQQQQYYVVYGTDEETLDQRSGRLMSSDDTSLTDQRYTLSLSGLSLGTTYYYQVVATFEDFTLQSDISSFTTTERAPTGAPVNVSAVLNNTVLSLTWKPVDEDKQNGEILFYTLTCTIGSNVVFTLNLTTIEEIDLGLYEAEETYSCEVYASNSKGNGPSATITVTTEASTTSSYLPFIPLGVRHSQSNEVSLPLVDDGASFAINIPIDFPFGSSIQSTVYVGTNGIISFGSTYSEFINTAFPGTSGRYLVAPFWDDINIQHGGAISYETFESSYFLDEVNAFLQSKRSPCFEGTWMLVAEYSEVPPFSGSGNNTFQAILITDGTCSYSIFTYKCGLMEWDNGATIGFSAGGNPYANNDPSSRAVACVNTPESDWSNVVYGLSNACQEDPALQICDCECTQNIECSFSGWFIDEMSSEVIPNGKDLQCLIALNQDIIQTENFYVDESFETNQQFLSPGSLSFLANLDIISRIGFSACEVSSGVIANLPHGHPAATLQELGFEVLHVNYMDNDGSFGSLHLSVSQVQQIVATEDYMVGGSLDEDDACSLQHLLYWLATLNEPPFSGSAEQDLESGSTSSTGQDPESGSTSGTGQDPESGSTSSTGQDPESGSTSGTGQDPESGSTSSTGQDPESGSTSGTGQDPESGSTSSTGQDPESGSTSGTGQDPESGSTSSTGQDPESGSTSSTGQDPESGSTSGEGQDPESGSMSGADQDLESGSTSGAGQNSESGSTSGTGRDPESGSTSGAGQDPESGSASGADQDAESGSTSGTGQDLESGSTSGTGQDPESGSTSGAGQDLESGSTSSTGQDPESGSTSGKGQDPESGSTSGAGQDPESSSTSSTGQDLESGSTSGEGQAPESGSTSGADQDLESGSASGTEQDPESGSTSGTGQDPKSGSTSGTGRDPESGSTSGAGQDPESGSTSGAGQDPESGSTSGAGQDPESGSTSGAGQDPESGSASGADQDPESGSSSGSGSAQSEKDILPISIISTLCRDSNPDGSTIVAVPVKCL